MINRGRISYFDTSKFIGRIRNKNEEWNSFGVRRETKKILKKVEKKIENVL